MVKAGILLLAAVLALSGRVDAQEEGGGSGGGPVGGGGRGGSGLPASFGAAQTIPQQFASKLKLDKTQSAAVDQILSAAATDAAPVAQPLLQARQRMLNAARANRADEVTTAQATYAASAAKVAGIEARAFAQGLALLKPAQQKGAPEAFALMAGLFSRTTPASAGGRGGRGGRGDDFPLSRFESFTEAFRLEGDKKKSVKAAIDDAHRGAGPARAALIKAHADLGAAVSSGKGQEDVDAAARAYGEQAAAMARIEMEALAKVIAIADPDLQNAPAIQAAFYLMNGMFLKAGRWDEIPDRNVPGY